MAPDPLPAFPRLPALALALVELVAPRGEQPSERRDDADDDELRRAEQLVTAGVEVLGADAAAVLLVNEGGPVGGTGSDEGARALSRIELGTGAGPALECCRAGRAQVVELASVADRWPGWAATATRYGWSGADAVPLRVAEQVVGAMVLLTRAGRRPPEDVLAWAGTLAAVTASALVQLRIVRELQRRGDQLQTALTSRVVIEQAKGVLAERGGLDVQTAFERMRRYARAHRHRLVDVARDVVEGTTADAVLTHARPLPPPGSILDR